MRSLLLCLVDVHCGGCGHVVPLLISSDDQTRIQAVRGGDERKYDSNEGKYLMIDINIE